MSGRSAGAIALLLTLAGCGYSFGTGLHEYDIRTVAFQVVGNDTYRQRLEVELSRYLARELPITTDLVLADRESADAILEVVLIEARERTLVAGLPDPTGTNLNPPRTGEGALEGAIVLRLVARDGSVPIERRLFDRTEFRSLIGESLTTARAELAEDLARKIALALESDF